MVEGVAAAVAVAAVVVAAAVATEVVAEAVAAAMAVAMGEAAAAAIVAAVTAAATTAAATMARGMRATPPPVAVARIPNGVMIMGFIVQEKLAMTTAFIVPAKLATITVCMSVVSQAMTKGPDTQYSHKPRSTLWERDRLAGESAVSDNINAG
mgnify:FL=1